MNVNPLQRQVVASDIAPEQLAGNTRLTQEQKIDEASRQFEAVLLRQILGDSQKTVIASEFSDNSTASGIYHDLITKTLADSISKSGALGLAKSFETQLNRPSHAAPKDTQAKTAAALTAAALTASSTKVAGLHGGMHVHVASGSNHAPLSHRSRSVSYFTKQP